LTSGTLRAPKDDEGRAEADWSVPVADTAVEAGAGALLATFCAAGVVAAGVAFAAWATFSLPAHCAKELRA